MTDMNHTKTLFNFIHSLIRENKTATIDGYYLDVNDLHDSDKENFAAHLIEFNSFQKEGWDFLFEDSFREELASTLSDCILSYGDQRESLKDALFNGLKQSSMKFYQQKMQELIDDCLDDVYREDMDYFNSCDQDDRDYQEARL
jgi:hypothetical protein